jgi:hypothetical protein
VRSGTGMCSRHPGIGSRKRDEARDLRTQSDSTWRWCGTPSRDPGLAYTVGVRAPG